MRRLLWPLGLTVAFGLGVAVGGWLRHSPATGPDVERLQAQVSALQARLRAKETRLAGQPSGTTWRGAPLPGTSTDRAVAAATAEPSARSGRLDPGSASRAATQDDRATPGRAGPGAARSAPTVEAALERFYQYIEEASGSRGAGRWQRMRELADELRGMGTAGAEALMRVLAAGTSSDERRAAAQLLGELGVPGALASLQSVLEKDSDLLLRRAAASSLRRLQAPESAPYLDALMVNPGEDRFVRMSAASGLAQMGRPQGVTGLMQIFDESNGDGRGREMAFRALSSLNDARALPFMRQLVTSDAEVNYRLQAIRFVAAQGDRQALPALQQLMQSPTEQPSIRDAAAQAHASLAGR